MIGSYVLIGALLFGSAASVDHGHYGFAVLFFGLAVNGMFIRLGDRLEGKP